MKYLTRKEELVLLTIFKLKDTASLIMIREHLNKHTEKAWSVGNVFVPLDRMEKNGFLTTTVGEPSAKRGGKAIKYYHLTEVGMNALAEIKKVNETMWKGISDVAFER